MRPLNIRQVLLEKKVEYLYVTSPIPAAQAGSTYKHRLKAESNASDIKFSLQSGPPGLTVSPDGELEWNVPKDAKDESLIVLLKNSAGRELLYSVQTVVTKE